jgi:O-antigen/teichoic acid export membrane protein
MKPQPAPVTQGMLSSLFSSAVLLIAIRVGGMVCAMGLMLLLARTLSPAALGEYAFAMSIALLGGLACTENYGAGAVRFLGEYASKHKTKLAGEYIQLGRHIVLRNSLLAAGGAAVCYALGQYTIALALLCVPFMALLRTEAAQVHALGHVVKAGLPGMLLRPLILLLCIALLLQAQTSLTALSVLGWVLATAVVVAVAQYLLFKPLLPAVASEKTSQAMPWRKVGWQLLIPVLFLELSIDTITVLAGLVLSPEDLAVLSITLRLQSIVLFGVTSINMAAGPRLSQAWHREDKAAVSKLLWLSGHLKFWPALLAIGLLALFGEYLLAFFGPHYAACQDILLILCLSPLVLALSGPTVLFMTVLGLQQRGSLLFGISLTVLALMIPVAGHFAGLQGIAWTVVLVWLGWNQVLRHWIKQSAALDTGFTLTPQ